MPKTNKERLQDNNAELQDIKTGIDNLPEYQDIEPIYATRDYSKYEIENPNPNSYSVVGNVHTVGDYLLAAWYYYSSSYSRYYGDYYLFKKEGNMYKLLSNSTATGLTENTSYGTAVIVKCTDDYIYMAQGEVNNRFIRYSIFNLATKTFSAYSHSTSTYLGDFVWSDGSGYVVTGRVNAGKVLKFNETTPGTSVGLREVLDPYNTGTVLNPFKTIFKYDRYLTALNLTSSTPTYTQVTYTQNIRGVNFFGDKIFLQDGIYRLNANYTVGEKLVDGVFNTEFYCLNDKYYMSVNTNNYINIYTFDENTNTFTNVEAFTQVMNKGGYKHTPFAYTATKMFNFNTSNVVLGIVYENKSAYFHDNSTSFETTSVLSGVQVYDAVGSPVVGTMPNNGALNYTPSSSAQTIPAGYTSGGTISAIDYSGQGALSPQDTATAEAQIEDLFGEGE